MPRGSLSILGVSVHISVIMMIAEGSRHCDGEGATKGKPSLGEHAGRHDHSKSWESPSAQDWPNAGRGPPQKRTFCRETHPPAVHPRESTSHTASVKLSFEVSPAATINSLSGARVHRGRSTQSQNHCWFKLAASHMRAAPNRRVTGVTPSGLKNNKPEGGVNLMVVLNEAFLNTEAQGSSTACILTLKGDVLHAVNIGDSGYVVIRGWKIVYKSPELKVGVIPGDIVVARTDGLFDNLYESEIEELVFQGIDQGNFPAELASTIAKFALINSMDRFAVCPFTVAAQEAGHEFTGGKMDDITVVVAYIGFPD
ncbi:hypothetical protein RHGRI_006444 [Rhododendron griersonianum]|uniref:Protein phosphatase n=1 Tax=Rhododendron griersonianum TaxID=479676 RepID=A0AAV6KT97_9ERIC|nr:hypothetical protein RHGRI_006444 [Rhododendron griersonianum]